MARAQRPVAEPLAEELILRPWWGPDPALRFILEVGDAAQQRAAISAGIKAQTEILQAQVSYLHAIQGLVGRGQ